MGNKTKHTPGPLVRDFLQLYKVDDCGNNWTVANVYDHNRGPEQSKLNARLLAAAYTSYDKHCGPRAVKCAEGGLLGELLESFQRLVNVAEIAPMPKEFEGYWDTVNHARTTIAKATGKEETK